MANSLSKKILINIITFLSILVIFHFINCADEENNNKKSNEVNSSEESIETAEESLYESVFTTEIGSEYDDSDDDNDGLTNSEELQLGTNPNNPDTDSDQMKDGIEVAQGTNPKVYNGLEGASYLVINKLAEFETIVTAVMNNDPTKVEQKELICTVGPYHFKGDETFTPSSVSGFTNGFSKDFFVIRYKGELVIPETGSMKVRLVDIDDAALVLLNGKPVVSSGVYSSTYPPKEADISVNKGIMSIEIIFYERVLNVNFELQIDMPGDNEIQYVTLSHLLVESSKCTPQNIK